jgi:3-dehydroquinate synthase
MQIKHQLGVELGERSYPIYIGDDLLGNAELIGPHIRGGSALVVTNTTVAPLYLDSLRQALDGCGIRHDSILLEDGEQYKTLASIESIVDKLLRGRYDRQTCIVALGGGVVGDIAGFAASVYQRGVDFIQIPTTLLAQVDSSVGGKTGVNHALGKNMIGAFYQPRCVIADITTLSTLPARELSAGLAEVIKYGLIHDAEFFAWLEKHVDGLVARDPEMLAEAVLVSCRIKARVVELDEREAGLRAILNLGHTFGHAIETVAGYGNWLHGEAVAAGTVMAIDLSILEGGIDADVRERCVALFERAGLPVAPPAEMTGAQFLEAMAVDKKAADGKIKLILLQALGKACVSADYDPAKLRCVLPD